MLKSLLMIHRSLQSIQPRPSSPPSRAAACLSAGAATARRRAHLWRRLEHSNNDAPSGVRRSVSPAFTSGPS